MADLVADLKRLRLYGMAACYAEGLEHGHSVLTTATPGLAQLVQAEATDRATRSIRYQMHVARFPIHRDLAGFDFDQAKVDRRQITGFATTTFTEQAENLVLIGGTGTGKTHLATALGIEAVTRHGKRVRFYSTVELVNTLEQEKASGRAGRLAHQLMHLDLVILDELGYLPFSQSGGALLFHLLSKLYEHTSVIITTNLVFAEWASCGPSTGAFHESTAGSRWERLISPAFTVPADAEYVVVEFDICYNTEDDPILPTTAYDGLFLRVTDLTPGRTLRSVLVEAFEDEFMTGTIAHYPKHLPRNSDPGYFEDMSAWAGTTNGMRQRVRLRLPGMEGSTAQLRFEYTQDSIATCQDVRPGTTCGVLIDNVVVQSVVSKD